MPPRSKSSPSTAPLTAWGGLRGALLSAKQQTKGTRIVTEQGEHGVVTHEPGYSIRLGGVPLDGGHTSILLDNGVSDYADTPTLSAELRPPDPNRIEPGLPYLSTDARYTPEPWRRMSPDQLYDALVRAHKELLKYSGYGSSRVWADEIAFLQAGMARTLPALLAWIETHPDHPERAKMSERELARLRHQVFGADSPFAAREVALLQNLRPDWTRDFREGDAVAVLEIAAADYAPGWTIARIDGELATVTRAGQRRQVPLWRLQVTGAAPRARLPEDQPARLDDLIEENLAHPWTDSFGAARFTARVDKAVREVLPDALRGWLGELGLDVRVRRTLSTYTVQPKGGAFTPAERAQLQALLPDARWHENGLELHYQPDFEGYTRRLFQVPVAPEDAERLSLLVSEGLRAAGFAVSRVGEERRHEAAASCRTLAFDLPGYGPVRVDCGDPSDPAASHSLSVKGKPYVWSAGRWLKNKVPPIAVLVAVRERGIRVFG